MEEQLVQRYADQGVRVVVALIQDPSYGAPSQSFCENWVSTYGLTNTVLRDEAQITSNRYRPATRSRRT